MRAPPARARPRATAPPRRAGRSGSLVSCLPLGRMRTPTSKRLDLADSFPAPYGSRNSRVTPPAPPRLLFVTPQREERTMSEQNAPAVFVQTNDAERNQVAA